MKHTSILICCDAGALGREILGRRDLDLYWALTAPEAIAVARAKRPAVVLAREDFALELLEGLDPKPPVVVLLEADGWARREAYFAAGATALVWAGNKRRIAEAVSELSGAPFNSHPRVPYQDVVDAWRGAEKMYLETVEISTSGVTVRDVAGVKIGDRLRLEFVMMEPPLAVSATVVRREQDVEPTVGLVFDALEDAQRARLEGLIHEELERALPLPEPVGLVPDLSGTYSLNLFATLSHEGDVGFRRLLKDDLEGKSERRLPHWLERVKSSLTPEELLAARTGAPDYASGTVDLRIALGRGLAEGLRQTPSREECVRTLDYCKKLAEQVRGAPPADLVAASKIRAGLLRTVYATILGPRSATLDLPVDETAFLDDAKRAYAKSQTL